MTSPLTVALLYGGASGEHEISLRSAASVLKHLDRTRYQVLPIGIDKQGQCFYNPVEHLLPLLTSDLAILPVQTSQATALPSLLMHGKFVMDADVVFPVMHGPLYEDGALQGLLALAQIACVGNPILSSAIGMDKDTARCLVQLDGIRSTQYRMLSLYASEAEKKACCAEVVRSFGLPLFVKPCRMGSSVGIHKVLTPEALPAAMADAFRFDELILIEKAIVGREIEVAVLENDDPNAAPVISEPGELKVQHADGFYSYAAKYIDSDQTTICIPADLPAALSQALKEAARHVFTRLKCRGMARIDFFVQTHDQAIYFNEINTLPGFTSISMYPQLMMASGIPYPLLLEKLIQLAHRHHLTQQQLVRDYQ